MPELSFARFGQLGARRLMLAPVDRLRIPQLAAGLSFSSTRHRRAARVHRRVDRQFAAAGQQGHGGGWTRVAAGPYSWWNRFSGLNELDAGQLGKAYLNMPLQFAHTSAAQVPLDCSVSDRRRIGR